MLYVYKSITRAHKLKVKKEWVFYRANVRNVFCVWDATWADDNFPLFKIDPMHRVKIKLELQHEIAASYWIPSASRQVKHIIC
jgi:hypothetical protein